MKILYCAIDQRVPGFDGGAVHVTSVAEGLANLGHKVHALVAPGDGARHAGPVTWSAIEPPLGERRLRLLRTPAVLHAARTFNPEVIIERYYNFGGEGLLAARRVGAMAVLEVNAPVNDYPGSKKRLIDKCLLVEPMRRWREWQCGAAHLIVTPSAKILPGGIPHEKVLITEWAADTHRFHPGARNAAPFEKGHGGTVVVFVGAFRAWHGASTLVDAVKRLRQRGRSDIRAVLVGDGPELVRVRQAAEGMEGVSFVGAVAHDQVPGIMAAADVGVAPFDVTAHRELEHEFHWSPLKIFEYMAAGLPVVAPRIPRLTTIVEDGTEGVLYDPAQSDGLANALERLSDPALRQRLGHEARKRAVPGLQLGGALSPA